MGHSTHSAASWMITHGKAPDMLEGMTDLQRDLNWLEKRDD